MKNNTELAQANTNSQPNKNKNVLENWDRILGWKEVRQLTGISRTQAWRLGRTGEFPRPRQLSENRVGWILSEVVTWIQTRPVTR